MRDLVLKITNNAPDIITLGKSVCRISCDSKKFNLKQPYDNNNDESGIGTGSLVDKFQNKFVIVTAHHVVSNHVSIGVYFDSVSQGQRFSASLLGANPHLDVAFLVLEDLTPENEQLLNDLTMLEPGESDKIQQNDKVSILGYALGEDHLQTSAGSISGRITLPNRLQTDSAINPGNSGGPMLNSKTNKIVGIVTSGYMFVQNINFGTPYQEVLIFKEKVYQSKTFPFRDVGLRFNCVFSKMSEDTLKQDQYKMCKSGIYVAGVHGNSNGCFEEGDLLCSVQCPENGEYYDIDLQGNISIPHIWKATKLDFRCILDRLPPNITKIGVNILRKGRMMQGITNVQPDMKVYREIFPDIEPVNYCIFGGLLVQMLNEDLLSETKLGNYFVENPNMILYSIPIITHVAAGSPFSRTSMISKYGDVIDSVVDERYGQKYKIKSLEEFMERVKASHSIVTIQLYSGALVSVKKEDAEAFDSKNISSGIYTNLFPPK